MIKSNKIPCEFSSFIDKLQPGRNYSNYKIVSIGNTNETSLGYHSFKTLLSFNTGTIDKNQIINAYLSIFIRKVETAGHASCNIGLYIGNDFEDYETITWTTLKTDDPTAILSISIPSHITNSLVRINITKLIKNHSKNLETLNLVLFPANYDEKYAVILSSASAKNPPFIEFQLKDSEIEDDMKLTNDKYTPDSADVRYSTLLTKLNNHESMIIDMHNNMNTITDNLLENSKQSSNIDSTIKSISNSINITNSNTTKIYDALLERLNNNETLIKDIQNNISKITTSLLANREETSNIDNTLSSLSNSINKMNSSTTNIYDSLVPKLNNNETTIKDMKNNINRILDKLTELNNIFTLINHESDTSSSGSAFPDEKFTEITAKLDETRSSLDKLISLLSTLSIQNIE